MKSKQFLLRQSSAKSIHFVPRFVTFSVILFLLFTFNRGGGRGVLNKKEGSCFYTKKLQLWGAIIEKSEFDSIIHNSDLESASNLAYITSKKSDLARVPELRFLN